MTNADMIRGMDDRELASFLKEIETKVYPWNRDRIKQCRSCEKIRHREVWKVTCGGTREEELVDYPCTIEGMGCPHGDKIEAWLSKEAKA